MPTQEGHETDAGKSLRGTLESGRPRFLGVDTGLAGERFTIPENEKRNAEVDRLCRDMLGSRVSPSVVGSQTKIF